MKVKRKNNKVEILGHWFENKDIPIVKINGELIALSGWNGELYTDCWRVVDLVFGIGYLADKKTWCAKPIYDGDEIIDYDLWTKN